MKTYVVDSSVSIKTLLKDEDDYVISQKIFSKYLIGKIVLIAPNLWAYEVANALRSAVLSKRLGLTKAKKFLDLIFKAQPALVNIDQLIFDCFDNSNLYNISIYDSAYITLAILNNIPLISTDTKLVRKINDSKIAINLRDFK